jgi:hypothetical protein
VAIFYRPGNRIQELGGQRRKGTVALVQRTGPYSRVWVRVDGRGLVAFYPAQISLI